MTATPSEATPNDKAETEKSARTISSVSAAFTLFCFTLVFTGLLAVAHRVTKPAIEASLAAEKQHFINEVLPAGHYDNNPIADTLALPATPELGQTSASHVFRARMKGKPAALVLEAIAPDGYAGPIRIVLGITWDGTLTGVRVIEHKETPGLGDYVDLKRDKDKKYPWILQFNGVSYPKTPDGDWKVRKDKGRFYYRTGATISPRAVIAAVHRASRFVFEHRDALFQEQTP
ncbi:MAG: electron transport complex subunit RsxG [Zoogloeaceae bacterium]|jgi:electron transport complex protein RnfG|nr:electron transport complex subunit RsxG [Zoogloeaceae bacterium]